MPSIEAPHQSGRQEYSNTWGEPERETAGNMHTMSGSLVATTMTGVRTSPIRHQNHLDRTLHHHYLLSSLFARAGGRGAAAPCSSCTPSKLTGCRFFFFAGFARSCGTTARADPSPVEFHRPSYRPRYKETDDGLGSACAVTRLARPEPQRTKRRWP